MALNTRDRILDAFFELADNQTGRVLPLQKSLKKPACPDRLFTNDTLIILLKLSNTFAKIWWSKPLLPTGIATMLKRT